MDPLCPGCEVVNRTFTESVPEEGTCHKSVSGYYCEDIQCGESTSHIAVVTTYTLNVTCDEEAGTATVDSSFILAVSAVDECGQFGTVVFSAQWRRQVVVNLNEAGYGDCSQISGTHELYESYGFVCEEVPDEITVNWN